MHVESVELRLMFGKNVIVDLAVYVTLEIKILVIKPDQLGRLYCRKKTAISHMYLILEFCTTIILDFEYLSFWNFSLYKPVVCDRMYFLIWMALPLQILVNFITFSRFNTSVLSNEVGLLAVI